MTAICGHCGISRQAHHEALKRLHRQEGLRAVYVNLMTECRSFHPGMGVRAMYHQLQPEGIGRDAFIVLGLQEGFRLQAPRNPMKTTYPVRYCRYGNLLGERTFRGINQVWVSDLFYFPWQGEHLYVVHIMDVYSRRILGYAAGDHMRAELFVEALNLALTVRGIDNYDQGLIHHSDRGSQYISDAYTSTLEEYGIQISMCTNVLENAHCERANGTLKNSYLGYWELTSKARFPAMVGRAVKNYNDRFHQSLKLSPIEFEHSLTSIPVKNREPLKIFTIKRTQIMDTENQLNLFEQQDLPNPVKLF